VRLPPEGVAFPVEGAFLAAMRRMPNLVTDAGDVGLAIIGATSISPSTRRSSPVKAV
jgi:hypothetical protein